MIGEERLRDAARTIRRLEYELADARRDVQRANDRVEQMRAAIAGTPQPWEPPTRPQWMDTPVTAKAKADGNPMPKLRWWRR